MWAIIGWNYSADINTHTFDTLYVFCSDQTMSIKGPGALFHLSLYQIEALGRE
jgi:hypothetical protein